MVLTNSEDVHALNVPGPDLLPVSTMPQLSRKQRVLQGLHLLIYHSKLSCLHARLQQQAVATVLMYHSVPSPEEACWIDPCNCISPERFEQQVRFLAQHRRVISLSQLVQVLEEEKPLERGTVVLTFDDGYRNNLTVAAPILKKYNLPATIYLATHYVTTGKAQWVDTLYSAFRARSRHRLHLPLLAETAWDLNQAAEQQAAYQATVIYLLEASLKEREVMLDCIDQQLAPQAYPPRLTLNWEEVRQLKTDYSNITIGVHTAHHIDLEVNSNQARQEIQTSIADVLEATGDRPEHFSYPYNCYNEQSQAQVIAAGLRSAAAVGDDPVVRVGTSCYTLPRLDAPRNLDILKSWTDGSFPDLYEALSGRSWRLPY